MIRILVDSYPEYKGDCPFCSPDSNVCRLKEEVCGNEFGYRWVHKYCGAFNENGKFDKEKCGIIITAIIFCILRTDYSLFAFILCICCGVISYLVDLSNKKMYRNFKNNIHNKNIKEGK